MNHKTQKLSIRLLKPNVSPEDTVREGLDLRPWESIPEARIALGAVGGSTAKWARFLALSDAEKARLKNRLPYGVVFVPVLGRWFAVTFGFAHVKLDSAKFEERFGLRVVLNSVDPDQLRSTDLRTPDENTISRRSQASRGSRQEAFSIDIERDIVQGLAGLPKDSDFASRVAGADALVMHKKMDLHSLRDSCAAAYRMSQRSDYKANFAWIDHVRHVRSKELISGLETKLTQELDRALKSSDPGDLALARPVIYDPMNMELIQYRGFRSTEHCADLEIRDYLAAMQRAGLTTYESLHLRNHKVHGVDDSGRDVGDNWRILDCLVFEAQHKGKLYTLSASRWYEIDKTLASSVQAFFTRIPPFPMPGAHSSETEVAYNNRLKETCTDLLCLDRKLVKPSDATSPIEVCDFLTRNHELIHVKDRTSSSRLSHLFNQGTVSGRVLIADPGSRNELRRKIREVEKETGRRGFARVVPSATSPFDPRKFTVVYAVLGTRPTARLPFFSLVALRQAVTDLRARGYQCAFAWVYKQ